MTTILNEDAVAKSLVSYKLGSRCKKVSSVLDDDWTLKMEFQLHFFENKKKSIVSPNWS